MPILSESNQAELREVLDKEMVHDVNVNFFTKFDESPLVVPGRECMTCRQTGELLHEVTALSDKLQLDVHDFYGEQELASELGIHRIPAFLLEGKAKGRVRFFGIPAGLEFPAFIGDLLDVSKGSTTLSEGSREALGTLKKDVHVQVFTTPT
jgi:alkyl hydroperoxide reductase subunit AhpF